MMKKLNTLAIAFYMIVLLLGLNFTARGQCDVVNTFPWQEGFEADWSGAGSIIAPNCWQQGNTVGSGTNGFDRWWVRATYSSGAWVDPGAWSDGSDTYNIQYGTKPSGAAEGNSCAYYNDGNAASGQTDTLFTPTFDLTGLVSPALQYKYFYSSGSAKMRILVSSDNGSTWTQIHENLSTGGSGFVTKRLDLTSYKSATVKIAFVMQAAWSSNNIFLDDISVFQDDCPIPSALALVGEAQPNQATVTWLGIEGSYIVAYKKVSETSWIEIPVSSTTHTLTELLPGASYQVKVRKTCQDEGVYSDVFTFTTPCASYAIPFTENFDTWGTGSGVMPSCWKTKLSSGSAYISTTYSSSPGALYLYSNYSTGNYAIAATPELDVANVNTLRARFKARSSSTGSTYNLYIGVMTDPDDESTFVPVDTITSNTNTNFNQYNISLSNYTGTGKHVAFRVNYESSSRTFYIDDLLIGPIPTTCLDVVTPTFTNIHPTDVTVNASFEVTNPVAPAHWLIYYKKTTDTDWSVATTTAMPYLLPGLAHTTTYQVKVQAVCVPGADSSAISDINTFTTQESCPKPTDLIFAQQPDSLQQNQVTVDWTAGYLETSWIVEYKLSSASTWESAVAMQKPYTITGLERLSKYDVRIRSYCGEGDSSLTCSNTLTFSTLLNPVTTLPYSLDFEDGIENWVIVNGTSTTSNLNKWYTGAIPASTGNCLYISNTSGNSNKYNVTNASVSHFLNDVVIPENGVKVIFDWRAGGEGTVDYLTVGWFTPTVSNIPVAGTLLNSSPSVRLNNPSNPVWKRDTVIIPASAAGTKRLVFSWANNSSGGIQPPAAIDNIEIIPITCAIPTAFAVHNVDTTAAVVAFTKSPDASGVIMEYKAASATTWTVINDAVSPVTLSDLTPNTSYEVRVKAYCGGDDFSFYTDIQSFKTNCGGFVTIPWSEGFEGNAIPDCWIQEHVSGTLNWVTGTGNGGSNPSSAHGGSYNIILKKSDKNGDKTKLITPRFNLAGLANPTLEFWHQQQKWSSDQDTLKIYYRNSLSGDWTLLQTFSESVTSWTKRTVALPDPTDNYYIAFEGTAVYGYGVVIDDISVYNVPCPVPSTLSSSDVTAVSARINWTAGTGRYVLEYKASTETDWTIIPDTTSPAYLTGLLPTTSYSVRVKTDCGSGDFSDYGSTLSFTTPCAFVELPWIESFTTVPPTCWTRLSGLLAASSTVSATTSGWISYTVNGEKMAGMNMYSTNKYWIVTPPVDLGDGTTPYQLSFDLLAAKYSSTGSISTPPETTGTDDVFAVVVSTDGGNTWSINNALRLWDNAGSAYVLNDITNVKQTVTLPLTGYSGDVRIAFYGGSTVSNADNNFYIDNVSISACGQITNLDIPAITAATAEVTWTNPAGVTSAVLEYKAASATDWTVVTDAVSPHTLSDLQAVTTYTIRIKSDCGSGAYGVYAYKNFTTPVSCPVPTELDVPVDMVTTTTAQVTWAATAGSATILEYKQATATDWITELNVTSPYTIPGLIPNTTYTVRIKADCGGDDHSEYTSSKTFTTLISCEAPTALSVSDITTTAAQIQWTNPSNAQSAIVEYKPSTAADDAWVTINPAVSPQPLAGLTPSTIYDVRVKSNCGTGSDDYSLYATTTFTTSCNAVTLPWAEGFENNGTVLPACWTQEQVVGTTNWNIVTSSTGTPATAHGGTYKAYFYVSSAAVGNISKLITPPLDLTGMSNPILKFWYTNQIWSSDQDTLRVYYRTSETGAWTLLQTYSNSITTWTEETIQLPNGSNDYYIAFEGKGRNGHGVHLDDISIYACEAPAEMVVSAITARTAQVTWTAPSEASSVLEYKLATATDWTIVPAVTSPHNLTGLTPDAAYQVRVKSDCGSGNTSFYVTKSFTTLIACFAPTALDIPAANITPSTAQITWTAAAEASSILEYKLATATDWTVLPDVTSPYVLPGLQPESIYNVRVKSDCDTEGFSLYTPVKSFITGCATVATVPWIEGFEDYEHGQKLLPCLSQISETGDSTWTVNQTNTTYNRTPRTGDNNITLYRSNTDWLFKQLYLEAGTAYNITLYARQDASSTSSANITVQYGETATVAGMTTTIIPATGITNGEYQKLSGNFVVPATGNYFVGIKGYSSSTPYYISVDDIAVTTAPCPVTPISFAVPTATVTSTTANVVWSSIIGTSYVIEYKQSTASDWTVIDEDVVSPYTLTGLSIDKTYNVRMRSYCVEGEYSEYTSTVNFTTPCGAETIPWFEGFEGFTHGQTNLSCYSQISETGSYDWTVNQTDIDRNRTPRTGSKNLTLRYGNTQWFFKLFHLEAGKTYAYSMYARQDGTGTTNADLTVKYGTAATVAGMTGTIIPQTGLTSGNYQNLTSSFTVPVTGDYYIGVRGFINSTPWYISIDDISIEVISCPAPVNLVIDPASITATTASISWDFPDEAVSTTLEYRAISETDWTEISDIGGSYDLYDLTGNVTYYVRVKAYCGGDDYSNYSETKTFTTVCAPVELPWLETFNGTTFPPACWTRFSGLLEETSTLTAATTGWVSSTVGGDKETSLYISGTTLKAWLVTPEINLGDGSQLYTLTFKLAGSTSASNITTAPAGDRSDDKLAVVISTDGGETWSSNDILRLWNNTGSEYVFDNITNTFQDVAIPLDAYTGSIKIAFYGESTVAGGSNYYHINDVAIASCPVPTELQVVEGSITAHTAEISWEAAEGAAAAFLEYKRTNATDWTQLQYISSPYEITDLAMGTNYTVRVKSFCGGESYSVYTHEITFTTDCEAVELPWQETFEEDFLPACWTRFSGALAETSALTSTTSGWTSATVEDDKVARLNVTGASTRYWLVTPEIDLGDGSTTYGLTFDLRGSNNTGGTTAPSGDRSDDKFAVVISTDGGTTWSNTDVLRQWDNQGSLNTFNSITNEWQTVKVPLNGYTGAVKIAFYGESTVSGGSNYYFVNNVEVDELASADIALKSINPITSSCDLGDKPVTIQVANFGSMPVTSFVAKYKVGVHGTPVSETVTPETPIATEGLYTYTFDANVNFPEGNDTLIVTLELSGDADLSDNQLSITLKRYPAATIPYLEDFNAYGTEYYLENWSVWNLNLDDKEFDIYHTAPDYYAYYTYNDLVDANDWIITSCIDIPAGGYAVSYDYAAAHPYYAENMEVYIGTSNTPEAMTTLVSSHQGFYNTNFVNHRASVMLEGGVYYVGIRASSLKGGMGIKFDNLQIKPAHVITATRTGSGMISPIGDSIVDPGTTVTYTFTPLPEATLLDVLVDNVSQGVIGTYTFNNVSENHTIEAVFSVATYNIVSSAGTGGTITPDGTTAVEGYASQSYAIEAADGYQIQDVLVDGSSVGTVSTYTFQNVTTTHTIDAVFIAVHTVTSSATGNGTIAPLGATTVLHGDSKTYTITPATGHHIESVLVNGVNKGTPSTYTFANIAGDSTIHVNFAINTYTIAVTQGSHGTVDPAGPVTANYGENVTFTFTPETGYHVESITVNGNAKPAANSYTMNNVRGDSTIHVTFAINTYTITLTSGMNGTVTPSDNITTVQHGDDQAFVITPNYGFKIAGILVDNVAQPIAVGDSLGMTYTFTNITSSHTISISFSPRVYTISATVENGAHGMISPSGSVPVSHGTDKEFTITPNTGYHIASVLVNGVDVGTSPTYTFTNVTGDSTIHVTFAINTYTITATVNGTGGIIDPEGVTTVQHGGSQSYTITPSDGFVIDELLIDGVSVPPATSHAFTNVTADRTIEVSFIRVHTITAIQPATGGTITPEGATVVKEGDAITYTITPTGGLEVLEVLVDGISVGAVQTYTFTNVTEDHTITANIGVGIPELSIASVKVYSYMDNVYIKNEGLLYIKEVQIFDTYGKLVYTGTVVNNPEIIPVMGATGNYIVRIITDDKVGVYKVFIQR